MQTFSCNPFLDHQEFRSCTDHHHKTPEAGKGARCSLHAGNVVAMALKECEDCCVQA